VPEDYTVDGVKMIQDVNAAGNLLDYLELTGRTNPHGVAFTVRVEDEGEAAPAKLKAAAAAKSRQLETLYE
jgi:hypothetical protein